MKLGVKDIIKVSAARQAYGYAKSRFEPRHLSQDLADIFGLEDSFGTESVSLMDAEDEAIKSLEGEFLDAEAAFLALPLATQPANTICAADSGFYYGNGPTCCYCGKFCRGPVESEERRLKREEKEGKELRVKDLTEKRRQRRKDLAAKPERISFFRS